MTAADELAALRAEREALESSLPSLRAAVDLAEARRDTAQLEASGLYRVIPGSERAGWPS